MSNPSFARVKASEVPDGAKVKCGLVEGVLRKNEDGVIRIYLNFDPKLHAAIAESEMVEVITEGEKDVA